MGDYSRNTLKGIFAIYALRGIKSLYSLKGIRRQESEVRNQLVRTAKQLGAALRNERVRQGLTQQSLSQLTGIGQKTISQVENGKLGVKLDTIYTLLAVLDLEFVMTTRSKSNPDELETIF